MFNFLCYLQEVFGLSLATIIWLINWLFINAEKKNKIRYMQYYEVFFRNLWEVSTYFSVKEAYLLLELYDRCFNSCLVSGDTCMIVSVGWYINQQLFLKFLNHIISYYNLKLKKSSNYFSCPDCQCRFNFFKDYLIDFSWIMYMWLLRNWYIGLIVG